MCTTSTTTVSLCCVQTLPLPSANIENGMVLILQIGLKTPTIGIHGNLKYQQKVVISGGLGAHLSFFEPKKTVLLGENREEPDSPLLIVYFCAPVKSG